MLVKPATGLLIRDPATRLIVPKEGQEVDQHDPFWSRAIRDGDVREVEPAEPAKGAHASKEPGK